MSVDRVGAVVLAAGRGSRIGTRAKCLLELDGEPIVRRLLRALAEAGVSPGVLVLGHHADAIESAVSGHLGPGQRTVRNPAPDDGPESSQRIGLAGLGGAGPVPDAVIMALADQPLIGAAELAALLAAWRQRAAGAAVLVPRVGGQRGNPVVVAAEVREAILAAPPPFGCRQWQAANPGRVAFFESDNPAFRTDIDTAEDLARFEAHTGRALRWPAEPRG